MYERGEAVKKVRSVYKFLNGMVVTLDEDGHQMEELQGSCSPELLAKIWPYTDEESEFHGISKETLKWSFEKEVKK